MKLAILIILSILPAIILLWYFEKQDKGRKEPRKLKWKIFGWGILATVIAAVIELNLEDFYFYIGIDPIKHFWLYIFLGSFVTAALVEEALKLWIVKTHVFRNKHFDEVMDGITYTIIASLGFATLENILYVLGLGYGIAIVRALISVPAHALFSGIMGFYIGKSRFAVPSESSKLLWKGFGIAIFYHGLFNFLLFTRSALVFLVIPLMIIMGVHLKTKINEARFADKVTKTKPQKFTAIKILKIFVGTVLIVVGIGSLAGSIMLSQDPTSGYTYQDIIYSSIFAVVLIAISYAVLKKRSKKH
ncbi:PrsW family intramembrane metalloprotease [Candidatus Peregrinibacteria bacterium]|nr:PrsW family intramembrane metalloprotease [Candidatus Peregrinibacteria bacterium]